MASNEWIFGPVYQHGKRRSPERSSVSPGRISNKPDLFGRPGANGSERLDFSEVLGKMDFKRKMRRLLELHRKLNHARERVARNSEKQDGDAEDGNDLGEQNGGLNPLIPTRAPKGLRTRAEFLETIKKKLQAGDPDAPKNQVVYSSGKGEWVPDSGKIPTTITLFEQESLVVMKDSPEGAAILKRTPTAGNLGLLAVNRKSKLIQATKSAFMLNKTRKDGTSGPASPGVGGKPPFSRIEDEDEVTTSGRDDKDSGTEKDEIDSDTEGESRRGSNKAGGESREKKAASPFGKQPALSPHRDYSKKEANAAANQFNFYERASQTLMSATREKSTVTEPPPIQTFSALFNQWVSYDIYVRDAAAKESAGGASTPTPSSGKSPSSQVVTGGKGVQTTPTYRSPAGSRPQTAKGKTKKKGGGHLQDKLKYEAPNLESLARSARIMERMINQNVFDSVTLDFRYWEDAADEFRDPEGILLPLWSFQCESMKKLAVTGLCWSATFPDFFAVSYGSYDFKNQPSKGAVCLYTLKNPSHPEYLFETASGVMCVDIHGLYPHLVAVGLYNGTIKVYNLKIAHGRGGCMWETVLEEGSHGDVVWQVCWGNDDPDGQPILYSVGGDGRVVQWTLASQDLRHHDVVTLVIDPPIRASDGSLVHATGCGTALAFHRTTKTLFVVATEEGRIYKGSTLYQSKKLGDFTNHKMPIYALSWNYFSDNIFLSASADWTIRIWDHRKSYPLFALDLGCEVEDAAWAPFSSTVLAAVTSEGRVYVYDLAVEKYAPICVQAVTRKKRTKCTHIAFNPVHPVILVGDDRGNVMTLKLSPNLRKLPKEAKNADEARLRELEVKKLETLLTLMKEP